MECEVRIVERLEPPLQLVEQRGLADAPLAVEQQAVVVDRLEDALDERLAPEEEPLVEDRRPGDVGVELAPPAARAAAASGWRRRRPDRPAGAAPRSARAQGERVQGRS